MVVAIVSWNWTRVPPLMERSLRDDLKVAFFVFLGAVAAYLLFGADDPGLLIGTAVGLAAVTILLNVVRRVGPGRRG
jgi:hypothetical protein